MSDRHSRSYDFTVLRTDDADDGLTLEGYAAVFNSPAMIRDHLGEYEETVAPGAFKRTINARMPILQFDHGTHPLIGSLPLGVIRKINEDDDGLFVRARLSDNWLIQPVRDAVRDGAVKGMSFQFSATQDEWNDDMTERTVREVKLYELGPVVWPAYEETTVGVRSEIQDLFACENFQADFARAACFAKQANTKFASTEPATRTSGEEPDNPPVEALVVDKKAAEQAGRIAASVAAPSEYLQGAHNE